MILQPSEPDPKSDPTTSYWTDHKGLHNQLHWRPITETDDHNSNWSPKPTWPHPYDLTTPTHYNQLQGFSDKTPQQP